MTFHEPVCIRRLVFSSPHSKRTASRCRCMRETFPRWWTSRNRYCPRDRCRQVVILRLFSTLEVIRRHRRLWVLVPCTRHRWKWLGFDDRTWERNDSTLIRWTRWQATSQLTAFQRRPFRQATKPSLIDPRWPRTFDVNLFGTQFPSLLHDGLRTCEPSSMSLDHIWRSYDSDHSQLRTWSRNWERYTWSTFLAWCNRSDVSHLSSTLALFLFCCHWRGNCCRAPNTGKWLTDSAVCALTLQCSPLQSR